MNSAFRLFAIGMCAMVWIAGPSSAQGFLAGRSVDNISDIDLMRFYGTAVRESFRTGNRTRIQNQEFLVVEKEVQRRGLVTPANYEEIEKGIVYLEMPLPQFFASINNLQRTDVVTFENFTISIYQGPPKDWANWSPAAPHREFLMVCNGKLMGYRVEGVTTFETFSGVPVVKSKQQTNFAPDHFSPGSVESQKWNRKGWGRPNKNPVELAKGGHLWFLFELAQNRSKMESRRTGPGRGDFATVAVSPDEPISERIDKLATTRYPILKNYLERACQ